MRAVLAVLALAALAACASEPKAATFTCPNGPDLAVFYSDEGATIRFPDGRVELLPRPDPDRPKLYAKPGYRFAVGSREARLDDGGVSYICDQMGG